MGEGLTALESIAVGCLLYDELFKLLNKPPPIVGANMLGFSEEAVGIVIATSFGLLLVSGLEKREPTPGVF
jgi:hypothetical protein